MVIVLTGPMGSGKTTIGRILSAELGWQFKDGDDFHPPENIIKMQSGMPLDDDDRQPWLEILHDIMQKSVDKGEHMVLACSALKRKYRRILGINQQTIHSVYLKGTLDLLQARVAKRTHEYMSKSLLTSQLRTLEEPKTGLVINIDSDPKDIVEEIINSTKKFR